MKRITIGRNPSCDIVIDNKMVSRNHALLNIYPSGKLEIVSMGTNGTKVKGHLISNGQRYPLRRGDDVTLAGCELLDWSLVPDPLKIWKIIGVSVAGAAILALIIWGIVALSGHKTVAIAEPEDEDTELVDPPRQVPVQDEDKDKKESDKKENDKAEEKKDDTKSNTDSASDKAAFLKLFEKKENNKEATGGKKTDTKKSDTPSNNDDMR